MSICRGSSLSCLCDAVWLPPRSLVCSPRNKQVVAQRLTAAALAHVYNRSGIVFQGPVYTSATGTVDGHTVSVTVSFRPETLGSGLVFSSLAFDHCPTELGVYSVDCTWYTIKTSDGVRYNATAAIVGPGGSQLLLSAALPLNVSGVRASSTMSGYGQWPVVTLYNREGFPSLPWNRSVDA